MNKITLAFYKGMKNPIDKIIYFYQKYILRSKYPEVTHVEIILYNLFGSSLGPIWYGSSGLDGGVRFKNIKPKDGHWYYIDIYCTEEQLKILKHEMYKYLYKSYDFYGIFFGTLLRTEINKKDKWICSELTVNLLLKSGIISKKVFNKEPIKYTPSIEFETLLKYGYSIRK